MSEHRAATLVHEAAHLAGANRVLPEIVDREDCSKIARTSPFRAVRNADNYGWFVIDPLSAKESCVTEQESWKELRESWAEEPSEPASKKTATDRE